MATLVAYFSVQRTTAKLASLIAEMLKADLFEIKPVEPYSAADIKWTNPLARCNREKIGKKDVPIENTVENWNQYDTVYLGFPIWYYGAPNIIQTFCKAYDWNGKAVSIFATSGGSDIGKTADKLKPFMKGEPRISGARVFHGMEELKRVLGNEPDCVK